MSKVEAEEPRSNMKRQEWEKELPNERTILHDAEKCGPTAHETIRHRWRFTAVLLASLLLAVAQPLTAGGRNSRISPVLARHRAGLSWC